MANSNFSGKNLSRIRPRDISLASRQISYTKDIIDDILSRNKRFKYDRTDLLELVTLAFDYIAEQTKENDAFSVCLEDVGYLYRNMNFTYNSKAKYAIGSKEYEDIMEQIQHMKRFQDETGYSHKKPPYTWVAGKEAKGMYEVPENIRSTDRQILEVFSICETVQRKNNKNIGK